jgi:Uma2 family endonuclease
MPEPMLPVSLTELPPTQADLPYDDGVPMESERHQLQMTLLIDALMPWIADREDGYVGGNMFVYYSLAQVRNQDFKGPDVFVVLGVPKGERKSWVVWEEGKAPDVVIELLSDSTAAADKAEKKMAYQNQMRVPDYFWYDPFNPDDWAGFSIRQGIYQPITLNEHNQLVSEALGLALQRWSGTYKGVEAIWLRWATWSGDLLLTPEEQEYQRAGQEYQRAEQERQRAEQERQRAEQERQRAERAEEQLLQTARNLLAADMTMEQVAQATGLTLSEVAALD